MANGSSSSVRRDLHRFFRRKIEIEKSRRIYQKPMPSSPLIIAVSLALVGSHRAPPPPACAFPPLFAKSGSGQLAPPSAPITQQRAVENELHNRSQVHTSSPTTALLAKTRRYCCASRCASHLTNFMLTRYIDDVIIAAPLF